MGNHKRVVFVLSLPESGPLSFQVTGVAVAIAGGNKDTIIMSVPYNLSSAQTNGEVAGDQTAETQQQHGEHHEPSYMDLRSQVSSGELGRLPDESERGQRPPSQPNIEKPETLKDDDDDDDSSNLSVSISAESRIGRPEGHGPGHGPKATRSVSIVRDGIESRHEVELGEPLEKIPTPRHLADGNLVTWDVDDPGNPKTWSSARKWAAVATVSTFTFISPVSSSMTARMYHFVFLLLIASSLQLVFLGIRSVAPVYRHYIPEELLLGQCENKVVLEIIY